MADQMPTLEPLRLSGLTYAKALKQMRETGCALRRPHWCNPVVVRDKDGSLWMDDEGEREPWSPAGDDDLADDWQMVFQGRGRTQ